MRWIFLFGIVISGSLALVGQSIHTVIETDNVVDTGMYITGGVHTGLVIDVDNTEQNSGVSNNASGIVIRSGGTGVSATSTFIGTPAILGSSLSGGSGVWGIAQSSIRGGVYGENTLTGPGVHGRSESTDGEGVYGENTLGNGVYGMTEAEKTNFQTEYAGVKGEATEAIGVSGVSESYDGVRGESDEGIGVHAISESGFGARVISTEGVGLHAISRESVAAEFRTFAMNVPDIEFPTAILSISPIISDSRGIISSDREVAGSDLELWSNDDLTVIVDRDNSSTTGSFQVQNSNGVNLFHVHEENGTDVRGNIEMKSVGGDDNGTISSDRSAASSDLILDSNHDIVLALDQNGGESGELRVENTSNTVIFRLYESGDLNIAGTLYQGSNIHRKHSILPVDGGQVLDKVAQLPLYTWKYIGEDDTHLGPMAQDFYATFGLGQGETTIASVDADGVALAGVKALITENQQLKKEMKEMRVLLDQIVKKLE